MLGCLALVPVARLLHSRPAWQRGARRRRPLSAPLALTGLIPVLLALLVYELPLFESSGECLCGPERAILPTADNGRDLVVGPVVAIDPALVTLDHRRIGTPGGDLAPLSEELATLRRSWAVLHPREPFEGRVLVEAHPRVRYGQLRRVTAAAAAAGYARVSFVVRMPK